MPCLDAAVPGLVVAVLGFDAKLPTVIEVIAVAGGVVLGSRMGLFGAEAGGNCSPGLPRSALAFPVPLRWFCSFGSRFIFVCAYGLT